MNSLWTDSYFYFWDIVRSSHKNTGSLVETLGMSFKAIHRYDILTVAVGRLMCKLLFDDFRNYCDSYPTLASHTRKLAASRACKILNCKSSTSKYIRTELIFPLLPGNDTLCKYNAVIQPYFTRKDTIRQSVGKDSQRL